ncbi:inositol monophosphatase family protein [Nonomuraea sp. NPDC059194]|uniref:inositol monophosphatase family protein n=1 Tax=Nonomuraea sp. NPDC059194 TaxID=3346764 RepID=UPI003678278A
MQLDEVTAVLREAAQTVVLPRYRKLASGEVSEKAPGELVTIVDRQAEELITRRLRDLLDIPVVGEEAVAAAPHLVGALREAPAAWLVDPLDGTANFVAGSPDFAVMVALLREGTTVASWILQPAHDRAYVAERGAGAWRDGERVHRKAAPADPAELRGAALTRFLSPAAQAHVRKVTPMFGTLESGAKCSGIDYPWLVEGTLDFILFHRLLPWDHAPGVLLLTEAGGVAHHLDAVPYRPTDERTGLLNAADIECWQTVRSLLIWPNA